MTKILLVEDDKSLREIYGVRLKAEGYDIVSAGDGEEALAIAIKERPELVVSDVMMPKVSGFDMLDILRSTTETKNIRVIVMTALSSEEQRKRGEMLGADKYLVKSQVGIEDVVRAVHDVLGDGPVSSTEAEPTNPFAKPLTPAPPVTPPASTTVTEQPETTSTSPAPVAPTNNPPAPVEQTVVPPSTQPAPTPTPTQLPTPVSNTTQPVAPSTSPVEPMVAPQNPAVAPTPNDPTSTNNTPNPVSRPGNRVIQPLGDPNQPTFNINSLLDKEFVKETGVSNIGQPTIMTTAEEQAVIQKQIDNHSNQLLSQAENAQINTLNNLPNAPITDQPTSTSSENSSAEIDAGTPPANVPSVPLQTREAERVIMPSDKSDVPNDALTGTTLPPTSIT